MKNNKTTICRSALTALLAAAVTTALPSCASVSRSSATPFPCQTVPSVIVSPAKTTFVNVQNGVPFQPAGGRAEAVGSSMATALAAKLNTMGVSARTGAAASGSLLTSRLTIHEGPGGSWDPNSGAITSTSSRMELEMKLTSGTSGKTLWEQTTVLREALDLGNGKLTNLANLALTP